jgi:CBS domain containing-hemolysin-like protein
VSMWLAGPLIVFSRIFSPFIRFLNGAANLLLRSVGLRAPHETERVHKPEELQMLLTQTYEHGLLREEPVEMIRGVFGLSETTAAQVMTPRIDVVALPVEMSITEAAAFILDDEHSRYPVYEESIDHVVGVVLGRDVWRADKHAPARGTTTLSEIMRPALFVPDSKSIESLLREMPRARAHLAVVVDEFGGTAGIVTIEDLIEEIVGDIADESDERVEQLERGANGEILVDGGFSVAELNDFCGLRLPTADYTTVGGFVLGRLGRVAKVGDEVTIRGGSLRVLAIEGRRIARLALSLAPSGDGLHEDQEAGSIVHP